MVWHRVLTSEDVATAHRLLDQHQPTLDGTQRCANALHYFRRKPPRWPCARASWAYQVLDAEKRGEITATQAIGAVE